MHSLLKLLIMTTVVTATGSATMAQTTGKKALLVIDVQENLLDYNSKLHMDMASVPSFIRNLNKSILFFEENNLPVIYTVNLWTNPILNMLTGNACKKGAKGTGIDKRVKLANKTVYEKSKMNVFSNPEVVQFLKTNSIAELYITGLFAEACIRETAKSGIKRGYTVTIIEDAVGSKSEKKKLRSTSICASKGSGIIKADQLEQINVEANRATP